MDLKVIESGNGGDFVKVARDLVTVYGFENMPYLAMFGGNVAASTPNDRLESEQAFDWWGNSFLMPNDKTYQFNSETERVLNTTPLTSAGRVLIEQAVRNDLAFMKEFATVLVVVSITATDRVVIGVRLQQPDNTQKKDFIYIWDATRNELDVPSIAGRSGAAGTQDGFDYLLDFAL